MKIVTIVGARPQFIKAAMVSRAISAHNQAGNFPLIDEEILHTGQHYDVDMSQDFFNDLEIPAPKANLGIRSAFHGEMTGLMLAALEREMMARRPDWVLVYGGTNSTLAGALAAAKLHIPVVHVEAGLRSFNRLMPEEINRLLTDHLSCLLFCPTVAAMENLKREGFETVTADKEKPALSAWGKIVLVGDVMYDAALVFGALAERKSRILERLNLSFGGYYLATMHRAENTDNTERMRNILGAFEKLSHKLPLVFPVHPRTRKKMSEQGLLGLISAAPNVKTVNPVSFLDVVLLEKNACCILTDSGGVQKEALFHKVPCVTLRDETEWIETVETGWNQIVGADPSRILAAASQAKAGRPMNAYGDGRAAEKIVRTLSDDFEGAGFADLRTF